MGSHPLPQRRPQRRQPPALQKPPLQSPPLQQPLPRRLPVRHSADQIPGRLVGRAIKPGLAELNANPRSRSATLRVIERVS